MDKLNLMEIEASLKRGDLLSKDLVAQKSVSGWGRIWVNIKKMFGMGGDYRIQNVQKAILGRIKNELAQAEKELLHVETAERNNQVCAKPVLDDLRTTALRQKNALVESSSAILKILSKKIPTSSSDSYFCEVYEFVRSKQDNINQYVRQLTSSYESKSAIEKIENSIAVIPSNARTDVVNHVKQLIIPKVEGIDKLIAVVTEIPSNVRTDVINYALDLFPHNTRMRGYNELCQMIHGLARMLARIPSADRGSVFYCLCRLGIIEMREREATELAELVSDVIRIPIEQRNQVTNPMLFVAGGSLQEKKRMLQSITNVPVDRRAEVIRNALQIITPGMHAYDKIMMFNIAANDRPADRAANRQRAEQFERGRREINAPHVGTNVHAGIRDQRTKAALELFYQHQKAISSDRINQANDEFVSYVKKSSMNFAQKDLVLNALSGKKVQNESFGPLIDGAGFSILGLMISGRDLIGRLWIFASSLTEPEQTNAKDSMISALRDSYDFGGRVCNQGKSQRLVVAVLQGRLSGVNIEEGIPIQVSKEEAMRMFFLVEAHQRIEALAELKAAANRFCDENPGVGRPAFLEEIVAYAKESDIL